MKRPNFVVTLTEQLMQDFIFKTMKDSEEIYYYDVNQGIYIPLGETLIKERGEYLVPTVSTHKVIEVMQKIRRRTFVDRDSFDSGIDILNVQNGLLDIRTAELHSRRIFSLRLNYL